ncbi:MAG: IS1 family transposase [Candidatus Aenigmarchaeota archaeon]|nr:IS1 family transposase [Candidatus Aenigmarchaeota archaeon]
MNVKRKVSKKILKNLYWKEGYSLSRIGKIVGMSYSGVAYYMKKFGIRRRPSDTRNYPKFNFSGNLIEKSYMLGFRAGDLYSKRKCNNIKIETTSSKEIFLDLFHEIFEKYGIVRAYERKGSLTKKTFKMHCYLNNSFNFLLRKPLRIPKWIIKNNKCFFSFFGGYSDAEGSWVITNHKYRDSINKDSMFCMRSCDKDIMHQIHDGLTKNNLKSNLYLERKKGTCTNIGKYKSDLYKICLYGKNALKLAALTLPFSRYACKKYKMESIIELENSKIMNLGTLNISCISCDHKKVRKNGSYGYKNKRFQRYKCPICKKVFSEQTLRKQVI